MSVQDLKPLARESKTAHGTAGVTYEVFYTSKLAQNTDLCGASLLLDVLNTIGPSDELAHSIENEMKWRRKVKIRSAEL